MKKRKTSKNKGLEKPKMQMSKKIFAVVLVSTMATGNFSTALLAKAMENKSLDETQTVADINRLIGKQSLSSELRNEYRVKLECGANGTGLPYEEQVVKKGEDLTLELIPDDGYEVSIIKLNGVEVSLEDLVNNEENNSEYTIKNIENNLIVYVEFKAKEAAPETYAKPKYNAVLNNPRGGGNKARLMAPLSEGSEENTYEGLEYEENDDGKSNGVRTVTITKWSGVSGDVVIPDKFTDEDGQEYTVTRIGEAKEILLEDGSTIIEGDPIFEWEDSLAITSVKIPETVRSIAGAQPLFSPILQSITVDPGNANYASEDGVLYALGENGKKTRLILCPAAKTGDFTTPEDVTSIAAMAFYFSQLTSVTIPESVTELGYGVFVCATKLESLTIPGTVTKIPDYMFADGGGCPLKNLTLGEGIKTIGKYTFATCYNLTSITLPSTVTEIGDGAFEYCIGLESITIPAGVTTIGASIFEDCSSLESVTFLGKIGTIGSNAFKGCSNLKEVIFTAGSTITEIPDSAFSGCSSLTSIEIPESVTAIGDRAFYSCGLESITIPAKVKTIGSYAFCCCPNLNKVTFAEGNTINEILDCAFSNCSSLTSIEIPESVTTIGNSVFEGCALKSIKIPAGVTSIANNAFSDCTIENITLEGTNDKYSFENGMLLEKTGENTCKILKCPTGNNFTDGKLTVPANVTEIADSAFYGCTNLKTVTFDAECSIKEIPSSAFKNCSNLTSIEIPDTVKIIGTSAFEGSGLESITLKEGVTTIGASAFKDCNNLTSIEIPDTVKIIETSAFEGSGLESITLKEGVTTIGASAFKNCKNLKNTDEYGVLTIPASVTAIGDGAFSGCKVEAFEVDSSNRTYSSTDDGILMKGDQIVQYPEGKTLINGELVIPNSATEIGPYAFANKLDIEKVVIPAGITNISDNAFDGCTNLKEVTFKEGSTLTNISSNAFKGCTSLKGITIPASVTKIGDSAFAGSGLESITIPANIQELSSCVFSGCTELKEAAFDGESKITKIPYDAFNGCTNLTNITLSEGVTYIYDRAFKDCTSLQNINLPDSLEDIHYSVFEGCTGLKFITIPKNVRNIEGGAFKDCKDLKYVQFLMEPNDTIEDAVVVGGFDVFTGTNLKAVYVTESFKNNMYFYILGINDKTYVMPERAPDLLDKVEYEFKDGQINFTWEAPAYANGYTMTRIGPDSSEETIFDKYTETNFNCASKVNSKGTYTFCITPHNYCNINPDSDDPFNRERLEGTPYRFTITSSGVNITNNDQGKVTIDKNVALEGDTVKVKVTPNEHYILDTLKINGKAVENSKISKDGTYTFEMPGHDVNISSTYFGVTIPNTVNNGKVEVNKTGNDGEVQVVITPDKNFALESLVINGVLIPAEKIKNNGDGTYTYTFIMNEGEEINVLPNFYFDVTIPNTVNNGKVEVNKTGNDGEVQIVITPDENFDLESLVINGVLIPAEKIKNNGDGTYTYTFIMNEGEEINVLPTFKDKKSDITTPDTIDNEKFETDSQTDGAKDKDTQNNISNFIKTSDNELGSVMMLALLAAGSVYTIFKKKRNKDK